MKQTATVFRNSVFLLTLLFSVKGSPCAFHEFPPFGADWYHPTFYQLLYNSNKQHTLGFFQSTSHYSRTFYLIPELPGEEASDQILREQIAHKTFFYQFHLLKNLECRVEVMQTNIDANAAADDGIIPISSAAFNQFNIFLAYDLDLVKKKNTTFRLQPAIGSSTNTWASHNFYSKIAWLKYEWGKFSPRLQAGNFTYALQTGLSGYLQHKNFNVYAGLNHRRFATNLEGYNYGSELNAFALTGYQISSHRIHVLIEPQAGLLLEKARYDTKEARLNKDEDVFAGGKDAALQLGGILSVSNKIQLGFYYFTSLSNSGFTEFQLFYTHRTQVFLQYSF